MNISEHLWFSAEHYWQAANRQRPGKKPKAYSTESILFFFGFLMCKGDWISCTAIIMTSDFLLDLMLCRNFDGRFFCRSCHWNCFFSRGELSSKMFSNVVFFNQFSEFFCTDVIWKLRLVRCETAFVFCCSQKKRNIVYRLLHRHQFRRGTRSGPR